MEEESTSTTYTDITESNEKMINENKQNSENKNNNENKEIGLEVFRIEGLVSIIKKYLDFKSLLQFKNIKKQIYDMIQKKIYIKENLDERSLQIMQNIKNITQIKFSGNIDYAPILQKINTNSLNYLIVENHKNSDCSCFSNLTNIKSLKFLSNRTDINFLGKLKNLEKLNIYFSPEKDFEMHRKYYDKDNLIINNIQKLTNLKILNISCLTFKSISTLSSIKYLEELDLRGCFIEEGYLILSEFKYLERLNLSSSNIEEISCLNNLINLLEINISCCEIKDLSNLSNIKNLKKLQMKWMRKNKKDDFKSLDISFIKHLISLEYLDLNYNSVENYSPISFLKNLKSLNLGNNDSLKDISFLENLFNLQSLDISMNKKIKNFSPVSCLPKLKKLNVHNIGLIDISFLENLKELNYLDLSDNHKIQNIKVIEKIRSLKKIIVWGTPFKLDFSFYNHFDKLVCIVLLKIQTDEKLNEEYKNKKINICIVHW